jgi:hypothetical protein
MYTFNGFFFLLYLYTCRWKVIILLKSYFFPVQNLTKTWTTIRTLIGRQLELWLDDNQNFDWATIRTSIGRQSELRLDDNRNFDFRSSCMCTRCRCTHKLNKTVVYVKFVSASAPCVEPVLKTLWVRVLYSYSKNIQSELWLDDNQNFDWTTIGTFLIILQCNTVLLNIKIYSCISLV